MTKLNALVQLSTAVSAEVNLSRDYSYSLTVEDSKIAGYLPSQSSRTIMRSVLGTVSTSTNHKAHLIQASYGTGKSYLLLMLANMLGKARSPVLTELRRKIEDKDGEYKDELGQKLKEHEEQSPMLVVIPKYGSADFNHSLLQALNEALKNQGIHYVPATNYRRAAALIDRWKQEKSPFYGKLTQLLTNYTADYFVELLLSTDLEAYQLFKQYFHTIVGTEFSENHADDVFVVFSETAKALQAMKPGFRGIAIFYDEFGDMLSKMLNSPEGSGLAAQDFLEKIKDPNSTKGNVLFLAATHQDVAALGEGKKDEVEKVRARFLLHKLDVTETEAEEILGTVFLHPDKAAFEGLLPEAYLTAELKRVEEHKLYPLREKTWIRNKILFGLHPLHPLTAFVLPRLSAEFAQNTRSMFNFLSPTQTETGSLATFLKQHDVQAPDSRPTVFTVDRLFAFFEKNLSEAKSESVQGWLDAYGTALGKMSEESASEQLFRAILLLTVVKIEKVRPRRDILFWAVNWPKVKQLDFDNLLAALVQAERLEFNPTDQVYEFPASGAKSVSKTIEEERQAVGALSLKKCLTLWEELEPRKALEAGNQRTNFGVNRSFPVVPALEVAELQVPIEKLRKYYQAIDAEYLGSGLVAHLFATKEADVVKQQQVFATAKDLQPYLFYAVLKKPELLKPLVERTQLLQALEATLKRVDIASNPARADNVRNQRNKTKEDVVRDIKDLYKPENWVWHHAAQDSQGFEFKSATGFTNWFNNQIDEVFTADSVPVVKDDALWFKVGEGASRRKALDEIVSANKDSIPLNVGDNNKSTPHNRILRNFFHDLELSVDRKTINKNLLGEIKRPVPGTAAAQIFKVFDAHIKDNSNVAPIDLLKSLLGAPFGLSRNLIKLLFACYVRLYSDQTFISDAKKGYPLEKSPDVLDKVFDKPLEYRLRYIAMSGPEARYLKKLRELFDNDKADSFGEVAKKFEALLKFMTPLKRELVHTEKGSALSKFYLALESLQEELAQVNANRDEVAKDFFIKVLPANFLQVTESQFEDGVEHVDALVSLIKGFKEHPETEERNWKLATLKLMVERVFKANITQKEEVKAVVQAWFKALPPANQLPTTDYGDPRIQKWLNSIRFYPANTDIFDLYLEELDEVGVSKWHKNLTLCQADYVTLFGKYRATVEAFTRSPVEVYQAIARTVFELPASTCSSELAFDNLWTAWWNELPKLTKEHTFKEKLVASLLDGLKAPLSPKEKYLQAIPDEWRAAGLIASSVPAKWEEWVNVHTNVIAEKYEQARRLIEAWQPPVTEERLFTEAGKVFGLSQATPSAEALHRELRQQWLPTLAAKTLEANWPASYATEAELLQKLLDGESIYEVLTMSFPVRWHLAPLKEMTEDSLADLIKQLSILKSRVEAYRRPLLEVVEALEKKKYENTADYQIRLYELITRSEAFHTFAEKETGLLTEPMDRLLLAAARANQPIVKLVTAAATEMGVSVDHHTWTKGDQDAFSAGWNGALGRLKTWKFPEDLNLEKAFKELTVQVKQAGNTYNLTPTQLRKVLNDVLASV